MHTPKAIFKSDTFSVKLLRNELVYDIDFASNRIAKVQFSEDVKKAKDITSEGEDNADWIDDTIESALANVSHKLRFCHKTHSRLATDETSVSQSHDEGPLYVMILNLPSWKGSADTLARLIHSYVVYSVLHEWLMLTVPQMASSYETKASDTMRKIVAEARNSDVPTTYPRL